MNAWGDWCFEITSEENAIFFDPNLDFVSFFIEFIT